MKRTLMILIPVLVLVFCSTLPALAAKKKLTKDQLAKKELAEINAILELIEESKDDTCENVVPNSEKVVYKRKIHIPSPLTPGQKGEIKNPKVYSAYVAEQKKQFHFAGNLYYELFKEEESCSTAEKTQGKCKKEIYWSKMFENFRKSNSVSRIVVVITETGRTTRAKKEELLAAAEEFLKEKQPRMAAVSYVLAKEYEDGRKIILDLIEKTCSDYLVEANEKLNVMIKAAKKK